jgi:hypothetical protein
MSGPVICAAPGCEHPVARRPGQVGRPPIYCSPACRPGAGRVRITVEVERHEVDDDVSPARHAWTVRLRRGKRIVVLDSHLGRFSADALARELRYFFEGVAPAQHSGDR